MPSLFGLGPDNPVAWAQFHRRSTVRNQLGVIAVYAGLLLVAVFVTSRLARRDPVAGYAGWANGMLVLQCVLVLLIGAARVSGMVRGDISSGMAESLRMMPVPPSHVLIGYLTANAATVSGAFVANVGVGAVATFFAELPVERWLWANLVLLTFSVFVWTLAAFLAFQSRGAGAILALCGLGAALGNVGLLYAVPGTVLLLGPLIGATIFNLHEAQTEALAPLALSLGAQAAVGAIFCAAAARKHRRPDAPALGPALGLLLLTTLVALSLVAIAQWELFQPHFLVQVIRGGDAKIPFVGSIATCMLVALAPLSSGARQHVAWTRVRLDDAAARRPVAPPVVIGLVVAAVLAALLPVAPASPVALRFAYSSLALAGFAVSVALVAALAYRIYSNARGLMLVWLFLYCAVPVLVDLARHGTEDDSDRRRVRLRDPGGDYRRDHESTPILATAAALSPVGLLIESWDRDPAKIAPLAAGFHLLIPLLPLALYARATRVERARAGQPT